MSDYTFKEGDIINSAKNMYSQKNSQQSKLDPIISEIVGQKVLLTDPRLISTVIKFKNQKNGDEETPDNLIKNPKFITAIKAVFSQSL